MVSALMIRPASSEIFELAPEDSERLQKRFSRHDDEAFLSRVAIDEGWDEAVNRYYRWQRIRGRLEMEGLMATLRVSRGMSAACAASLFVLAYQVFMPAETYLEAAERVWDDEARVVAAYNTAGAAPPSAWSSVIASATWHRRKGWYEAMGVDAIEALPEGPEFVDPALIAEVTFRA